ncbi:hypothetical protein UY3_17487 [Chelonia mydas]|uniref:Uncharacterized protein n=1 Tax=Chelonia mydas TaxID=8469 RepID=M7BB63_CHEMY|nr:hypothetical protein UY3_17487 [Chelonia mydas]
MSEAAAVATSDNGEVRRIAAPTGCGSPLQANGGSGKQRPAHSSVRAASCSPHWPGAANYGQGELRSAEPVNTAGNPETVNLLSVMKDPFSSPMSCQSALVASEESDS